MLEHYTHFGIEIVGVFFQAFWIFVIVVFGFLRDLQPTSDVLKLYEVQYANVADFFQKFVAHLGFPFVDCGDQTIGEMRGGVDSTGDFGSAVCAGGMG